MLFLSARVSDVERCAGCRVRPTFWRMYFCLLVMLFRCWSRVGSRGDNCTLFWHLQAVIVVEVQELVVDASLKEVVDFAFL